MKRSILFNPGSGGNHIRWLMYLDKNFDSEKSLEEKLKFIKETIYSQERTHHNWIKIELQHRGMPYDNVIRLPDNHVDPRLDDTESHTIFIKYRDFDNPFEHYFCLHPSLNWKHPSIFKKYMYTWFNDQVDAKGILPPNKKAIFGDSLWSETLDKTLYYDIINFWNLEDHYEYANEIHKLWNICKKRAYRDFHAYYTGEEFNNFLKSISLKGSAID